MNRLEVESFFRLAAIPVVRIWELPNGYQRPPSAMIVSGPDREQLHSMAEWGYRACASPWWLVKTSVGCIELGWRKRVMNIDWSDTPIRKVITEDDTTKSETMVHAWTTLKAMEYLTALAREVEKLPLPLPLRGPLYDPPCPDMTLEDQVRHARGFAQGICRNDHHVSRLLEQMARSIEALAALPVQQPIAAERQRAW